MIKLVDKFSFDESSLVEYSSFERFFSASMFAGVGGTFSNFQTKYLSRCFQIVIPADNIAASGMLIDYSSSIKISISLNWKNIEKMEKSIIHAIKI